MKTLREYGELILGAEPVVVRRTPELNKKFTDIANEIYRCPVRNKNRRSYKNVLESVEKMVIEHALAQFPGLQMNQLPFDHTIRESYAYDVVDSESCQTFECKRWADKWFSFDANHVATMQKNIDIVDYLVCARVFKTSASYTVAFHLIADAKKFEKYVRPSQYTMKLYYDHVNAMRNGDAVYRDHVYFNSIEG